MVVTKGAPVAMDGDIALRKAKENTRVKISEALDNLPGGSVDTLAQAGELGKTLMKTNEGDEDIFRAAIGAVSPDDVKVDNLGQAGTAGRALAKAETAAFARAAISVPSVDSLGFVYATDYGCKFDGVTDDTVAFQSFVSYIAINGRIGIMPRGTAKLTAKIDVPRRPGWQLRGSGREVTTLKQFTDNTPILDIGAIAGSQVHSYALMDFGFDYANTQPATNLTANPIVYSQESYWGTIERLTFRRGSYAMRVANGIGGPWGSTFDDLTFKEFLTLGAMDWSQCINGVPNNRFGRIFMDATNATGILFDVRGYNFVIDTLEICQTQAGAQLLRLAPSTKCEIGTLKLENGTYTTSNVNLIELQGNAYAKIGHMTVGGHTMVVNIPGGQVYLVAVNTGAGVGGYCTIDYLDAQLSDLTAGNAYIANAATNADGLEINRYTTNLWKLINNGSTSNQNQVTVRSYVAGRVSGNRGDADFTITAGSQNIIVFNTPLTAPRTVTLPTDLTKTFNGQWYRVVSAGAVNGSNTLTVKQGTTTVATLTADNTSAYVVFRRNTSGTLQEWMVVPTNSTGGGSTAPAAVYGQWGPSDHGLVAWAYDPAAAGGGAASPAGTLAVVRLKVPASTVNNIVLFVNTAGSGLTTGQCYAALYDASTRNLLGQTADQATAWQSVGVKTMALSAPVTLPAGEVLVAFYWTGTTGPQFSRGAANNGIHVGLSAANSRYATSSTGLTTAPPATAAALSSTATSWWAGLS